MAVTGDTIYLVVETEAGGGAVRQAWAFRSKGEAVDHAVEVAVVDGYLASAFDEEVLRKLLDAEGHYDDGDVRTTITSCFLADDPGKRRD